MYPRTKLVKRIRRRSRIASIMKHMTAMVVIAIIGTVIILWYSRANDWVQYVVLASSAVVVAELILVVNLRSVLKGDHHGRYHRLHDHG